MLCAKAELRARWPHVADRYDRLRGDDGLHPAAVMTCALTNATNAGWDPVSNPAATPRPPAPPRLAVTAAAVNAGRVDAGLVGSALDQHIIAAGTHYRADRAGGTPDDPATPAVDEHAIGLAVAADHRVTCDQAFDRDTAAELALRWHPPVGATTPQQHPAPRRPRRRLRCAAGSAEP